MLLAQPDFRLADFYISLPRGVLAKECWPRGARQRDADCEDRDADCENQRLGAEAGTVAGAEVVGTEATGGAVAGGSTT